MLLILLFCAGNLFAQPLMINETKRTVKSKMNSSSIRWTLKYDKENTLIYKASFRTAIYKFEKVDRIVFKLFPTMICNELLVEVPSTKVDDFIKKKEMEGCWIPIDVNLWEYKCESESIKKILQNSNRPSRNSLILKLESETKFDCIIIERYIEKNKSVFSFKEFKD